MEKVWKKNCKFMDDVLHLDLVWMQSHRATSRVLLEIESGCGARSNKTESRAWHLNWRSILLAASVVLGVEPQCHSALSGFPIANVSDHGGHLGQSNVIAPWICSGSNFIPTVLSPFSVIEVTYFDVVKIKTFNAIGAAVILALIEALIFLLKRGQVAGCQSHRN